jgi:hypothetical protein
MLDRKPVRGCSYCDIVMKSRGAKVFRTAKKRHFMMHFSLRRGDARTDTGQLQQALEKHGVWEGGP